MTQFEFPPLPVQDIMVCLSEFFVFDNSVKYSEQDLLKPEPQRIQQLYTDLLGVCNMPFQQDCITIQPLAGFHVVQHPELHENSFPLISFSLVMQRCLSACGANDFKICDLTCPKPKRTARFVSALINWKKFADDRLDVYDKIKGDMVKLQERRIELLSANDEARSKINMINAKKAEKEPQLQQLQGEIEEMSGRMNEYQKHQIKLQTEIQQIKTDIADKTAKTDQIKCHQLELKEQADKLRSLIVQSPERMKSDIARTKHNIQAIKASKEEVGIKIQELGVLESKRENLLENAVLGVKLITAINAEMQKQREAHDEIMAIQDKLCAHKDVLRDTTASANQLKRQLSIKQDKLSKMLLQYESKMRSILEEIQITTKARDTLMAKRTETSVSVSKINEVVVKKRKELDAKLHAHHEYMNKMQQQYKELLEALDGYHTTLAQTWDEVNPKNIFKI